MKLSIQVDLDIKGTSRDKLFDEYWEGISEEIDSKIADTYYVEDDNGNEKEIEISVDLIGVIEKDDTGTHKDR